MICSDFKYIDRGFINMKKSESKKHETCGNCEHLGNDDRLGIYCKKSGELL